MNRKANISIAIGLLLLAAALCLVLANRAEANRAATNAESLVQSLEEKIIEENTGDQSDHVPSYILDPEMDMPVVEIDGNECIGIIKMPTLSLALPVISQWSYPKLKLSPCRFSGSAYLDNMIVIAHNYPKHFGDLKNLNPGDEIVFVDADGNIFAYSVTKMEQLGSMDIDKLNEGQWDLTLLTCTIGGERRVTVRCERIKSGEQ